MAKIIIPTPLRKFTENQSQFETTATTVKEAILELTSKYTSLTKHLLDPNKNIRSFIRIYLGEDDINSLEKELTPISENATISIVPAIAGGTSLRLGDIAPDFKATTTDGEIEFHNWLGESWGVLFSHPADYTPVCTTELGTVAKYADRFKSRNVKVAALSVDPLVDHEKWVLDINETQNTTVNFPLIADTDRKIAELYDMIHPNADSKATVRSVFVIDPNKVVKLIITYPPATGRNFDEIIRVIDSLQLTAYHKVATPANWKNGDDVVVVPSIATEDISKHFPKGYTEIKPYLRTTPQPVEIKD